MLLFIAYNNEKKEHLFTSLFKNNLIFDSVADSNSIKSATYF